jgi:hypothetical protein
MSNQVYANGNEIACKSGDGKVIAAMPDVCLSPPSPPAGPVPLPYPNTSFSKDMQEGSKTVQIDGKEVMLKDQSYYATSPLGDEAATKSFGGSVVTHVITGKTYFSAWSMDVEFEGANVDRHLDLTTSNHASYPGSTPPFPDMEELALLALKKDQCPCCQSEKCTAALPRSIAGTLPRTPYSYREWYQLDDPDPTSVGAGRRGQLAAHPCQGPPCPNAGKADRKSDPPCDVYRVLTKDESEDNEKQPSAKRMRELRKEHKVPMSKDALAQKVLGSAFATSEQLEAAGMSQEDQKLAIQVNHRTPRAAGGCPSSKDNTEGHANLCGNCKRVDQLADSWSSDELVRRRAIFGL